MTQFDVVVAGGGAAGMCCAASLAEAGVRVALVSEHSSFEWSLRDDLPDGRGHLDELFHHYGWAGGAWFPLARRLKLPLRFITIPSYEATFRTPAGDIDKVQIEEFGSADALTDYFFEGFKRFDFDLGEVRHEYLAVLDELMSIDLADRSYGSVGFMDWLGERNVNFVVSMTLNAYAANLLSLPHDLAAEHLSVTSAAAGVRGKMMGEGVTFSPMPDGCEGVFGHFAAYIQAHGGTVLGNANIAQVIVEGDRAAGVVLTDGQEIRAATVALAAAPPRIREVLGTFPTGVKDALDYLCDLEIHESYISSRLERPIVTARSMQYFSDEFGADIQVIHPLDELAPWSSTGSGQRIVTRNYQAGALTTDPLERQAQQNADTDEIYPGFTDAVTASVAWVEGRNTLAAQSFGPKLPRTTEDIRGLWFVGEGSEAGPGLLGCEAGAASGIAGAASMVRALA